MYSEIDALGLAEAEARRLVTADRRRYAPFYAAAEALAHDFETLEPTDRPKIRVARPRNEPASDVLAALPDLERAARAGDRDAVRAQLAALLPEARLSGEGDGA